MYLKITYLTVFFVRLVNILQVFVPCLRNAVLMFVLEK